MLRLSATLSLLYPSSLSPSASPRRPRRLLRLRALAAAASASPSARSLRLLEWGKVCCAVASFAGTAHGREATEKQLWAVEDVSYEQIRRLLQETEAPMRLLGSAGGSMGFSGLDTVASPELRRYREQVQALESSLCQLMDKLIRNADNEASLSEVSTIVNGRCCIKITGDKSLSFDGLLLSSGSDDGSMIEPIVAVPLNDELQGARTLVARAELDAL